VSIEFLASGEVAREVAGQVRAAYNERAFPSIVTYHIDKSVGANGWHVNLRPYLADGTEGSFSQEDVRVLGEIVASLLCEHHMATGVVLS
jgi:hypothetical protein